MVGGTMFRIATMRVVSRLTAIPDASVLGRFLRLPLRFLPRSMSLRILGGGNRGYLWTVGAGNHSCWLGTFDANRQRALVDVLRRGDVFLDVGAHSGFFTLLGSRLVGPDGTIIAFEPLPANIHFLRLHIATNRVDNVSVFDAAVSDTQGEEFFAQGQNTYTGELSAQGQIKVRTVTLDELVTTGIIPPANVIKIDVEGAELRVLKGAEHLLKDAPPRALLVSAHGDAIAHECIELLSRAGYSVSEIPPDSEETELLCLYSRTSEGRQASNS